jgi:hypothetical protein
MIYINIRTRSIAFFMLKTIDKLMSLLKKPLKPAYVVLCQQHLNNFCKQWFFFNVGYYCRCRKG